MRFCQTVQQRTGVPGLLRIYQTRFQLIDLFESMMEDLTEVQYPLKAEVCQIMTSIDPSESVEVQY